MGIMSVQQWSRFLRRWNQRVLQSAEDLPPKLRERGWLGFPPATKTQLRRAERRLGYALPPSYRNFLLASNGWRRPSFCVDRIRPIAKVQWLEVDDPSAVDAYTIAGDSLSNYAPEDYFAYDGRPIFDAEHFRACLLIADPTLGDSMIYVLNPKVVAADGEWEAWRHAHWIPGAERFPSFELLIRAEAESVIPRGDDPTICGPFKGVYAPQRPRHAAAPIGPGAPKPRRPTIPELIVQLQSPSRTVRLRAADQLLAEAVPHQPEDEHPEIVKPLARVLRSRRESKVRCAAAAILGSYGDATAIPPLAAALTDRRIAAAAIDALGYLAMDVRDSRIGDAIVRLLRRPHDDFTTDRAVQILVELSDPRVVETGLRLLDKPQRRSIRARSGVGPAETVQHQRSALRQTGAAAVAKVATAPLDLLEPRLDSQNPQVRAAAAGAICQVSSGGARLRRLLNRLANDSDTHIAQAATLAIARLKPLPKFDRATAAAVEDAARIYALRTSRRPNRFRPE
jgi:HEAT repeat protein